MPLCCITQYIRNIYAQYICSMRKLPRLCPKTVWRDLFLTWTFSRPGEMYLSSSRYSWYLSIRMMGGNLRAHIKPLNNIVLLCLKAFKGAINWAAWCRKSPVFQTADRLIVVVFPVWNQSNLTPKEKFCPKNATFMLSLNQLIYYRDQIIRPWTIFPRFEC